MATFSKLTRRTVATKKYSTRRGKKVERLIIHHTAGGSNQGNVNVLSTGKRKVSSNYVLQTTTDLVGIVPEEYRAWTSGSHSADGNSVTVETVNSSGAPNWEVTQGQLEVLAQLAADLCVRYGWGKLDRKRVMGHREFASTACPGPFLWGKLGWIINRGNQIIDGKNSASAPPKEGGTSFAGERYEVRSEIPGYVTAADALARKKSNSTVPAGKYHVFRRYGNAVNITRNKTKPGWWIRNGDGSKVTKPQGGVPSASSRLGTYRVDTKSMPLLGRSGPGKHHRQTMRAYKGAKLNIVAISGGWAKSSGGHWYSMEYLKKV